MQLSEFDYHLPKSFIAQKPLKKRDESKLMVLDRAKKHWEHHQFFDLPELLEPGSVLVLNESKVIPARLQFKLGNGKAEILLIKPVAANLWECMVKPGPKFQPGTRLKISDELDAKVIKTTEHGLRVIEFSGIELEKYLDQHGQTPLPPYIKETLENPNQYQTIYAKHKGSVAAPTAGFHFTERTFQDLKKRGIETAFITLHVGPGTFQPVKTENIEDHKMHSEWFSLTPDIARKLNQAKQEGRKIVAVGTTAVRVLESSTDESGYISPYEGETDIFIYPGYKWKVVDSMITNFHVPKSTLLMLVSAFAGRELILEAYEEAKRQNYRFFSFGDSMLIR